MAKTFWHPASAHVRRWTRTSLIGTAMCLVLILALLLPFGAARPAAAAAPIPPSLPPHFMLGLASGPGDEPWMRDSGIPWDARYQYLSGGVNTGNGWASWNTNADFAAYYMQVSAGVSALPTFTYYQLLQSAPSSGSTEAERNYNNLNNATTMRAYYADFKLLLDKIRAFGKPVVVHVEPDLFGYMQQRVINTTNSAASVPAAVASSGHAEVQGLPDTFQGFNWALLRLRDRFAPNALLALHVSAWTTGIDIGSNSDPNLNVAAEAQRVTNFHKTAGLVGNPSGVSSYDLLFFDPLDRDAGFYEHQWGDKSRWWDETNQRFPNFNRYHAYVKAITTGTNRRAMLWQVPIGNTKYRTVNNTWNHYQDNRVQCWLGGYPTDGHLQGLADAGVIGILFGRGAGGNTTYTDAAGDGVTNPAPINGNDRLATHADDDGGYLRLSAHQYYQAGAYRFGTTGATATPSPTRTPAPSATGTPIPSPTMPPAPSPTRTSTTSATAVPLSVYADALAAGWADWSWDPLTRDLANASPVNSGKASIAVTYTGGWSALQLGRTSALSLATYDTLRFWIRGSTGGGQIEIRVGNATQHVRQVITPPVNTWTQVDIPVATLASGGVTYVWWQNLTGNAQPTLYLDDIAFIDK